MTKDLLGSPIRRWRGDTAPDQIVLSGRAVDGFEFTLTVSSPRDPDNSSTPVAQIAGVIVHAGPPGIVRFPWTVTDADQQPGRYWYDIEQRDGAGRVLTIAKNAYLFVQDITK